MIRDHFVVQITITFCPNGMIFTRMRCKQKLKKKKNEKIRRSKRVMTLHMSNNGPEINKRQKDLIDFDRQYLGG